MQQKVEIDPNMAPVITSRDQDIMSKIKFPASDEKLSIHHLLALAKQRAQHVQSKLTLRQLKDQAREKAKSRSESSQRAQPKPAKRNKKNQLPSPMSSKHSEIIKMNTGVLYLCRGEIRRVIFVRKK